MSSISRLSTWPREVERCERRSHEADGDPVLCSQLCGGRRDDSCQGQEGEDESQAGEQESIQFGGESAGDAAADQEPEPAGPAQVQERLICVEPVLLL